MCIVFLFWGGKPKRTDVLKEKSNYRRGSGPCESLLSSAFFFFLLSFFQNCVIIKVRILSLKSEWNKDRTLFIDGHIKIGRYIPPLYNDSEMKKMVADWRIGVSWTRWALLTDSCCHYPAGVTGYPSSDLLHTNLHVVTLKTAHWRDSVQEKAAADHRSWERPISLLLGYKISQKNVFFLELRCWFQLPGPLSSTRPRNHFFAACYCVWQRGVDTYSKTAMTQ